MSELKINFQAPDFKLPANGGKEISLSDYKGKYLILYFYPKDDTPGCTQEAKDFKENYKKFAEQNAEILGVSKDDVKSHDKFKNKYELNFDLISDEELEICKSYGVWVEKSMYGRKYMGIDRATFLISPEGKILEIWRKVKVKNHINEVLAALREKRAA